MRREIGQGPQWWGEKWLNFLLRSSYWQAKEKPSKTPYTFKKFFLSMYKLWGNQSIFLSSNWSYIWIVDQFISDMAISYNTVTLTHSTLLPLPNSCGNCIEIMFAFWPIYYVFSIHEISIWNTIYIIKLKLISSTTVLQ